MNTYRETVNWLCRFWADDPSKIATVMAVERYGDRDSLIRLLEEAKRDLEGMIDALRALPQPAAAPPEAPKRIRKKPRYPAPNGSQTVKQRRWQLKRLGYILQEDSRIVYYDDHTHRLPRTEQGNSYGFIFRHISER